MPRASFVIATHKRVDALRSTLRSLQLQTCSDWEAVVVGDCCEPDTGAMLAELADPRVRYYNLTERFGEQSGPNSFGLALVRSPVVCFLNHDDLLLPDHLEQALRRLKRARADVLLAPALKLIDCHEGPDGRIQPEFLTRLTLKPALRDLRMLLRADDLLYDPSSFWLVRSRFARRVGPWAHSSQLWRTPLRDWLLRAWRRGGRFVFTPKLAGIRLVTHNHRGGRRRYNVATPEHQRLIRLFESQGPDQVRAAVPESLRTEAARLARPLPRGAHPKQVTLALRFQALLYRRFGLDWQVLRWRVQGVRPGALHCRLLRARTGETIAAVPDLSLLLADPERYRVL
ncbi:MAG: glycosyltransferase family 2 protein [Prochlorococcaceae cyanobacterium]